MKAIFVFPDYTHLNGLGPWAFPGCRHGEERSNPTLNNEIKNNILLLTDCFSKGSEQAVPTNDGYPEIVALKQVPRN